ncbi:MAG: glycine cleavage system aminomethyltransferase GcvT [Clostridiaceae bacterium]|jgi:aminomethyltransferase|nr:glycine cleavage system aminomethyltransferase GcvT [Clostridiaceae bacterium]
MKKTPLYEKHLDFNAKMTDFGGWLLPLEYTGIIEEHKQVRNAAGLFDVSHMGEVIIRGKNAGAFLQQLLTNDMSKAADGRVIYSPMCCDNGGVVDDLLVYRFSDDYYLLVTNAANTDKDFEWIREHLTGGAEAVNVSDSWAQLAIQGPCAESILQQAADYPLRDIRFFAFVPEVNICGVPAMVSRTGYTGEDGFEVYIPRDKAPVVWEGLLELGRDKGLVPAGLGARDTLRLEAALPLYGHELSPDITPLEAGLGAFVKLNKDSFIGKEALLRQHTQGLERKLTGFVMTGRGIPRSGYDMVDGENRIGFVTSGSYSPSLGQNIGMAMADIGYSQPGTEVDVIIRNKPVRARTVELPFYRKKYRK